MVLFLLYYVQQMLSWVVKEVESPYGSVATLHWAVDDSNGDSNDKSRRGVLHEEEGGEKMLNQQLESAEDQLGAVLWNSNTVALQYLQKHVLCGKADTYRIVELGGGVGCLGIALAMAGARVITTDMKELVPLMQRNIELNAERIKSRSQGRGSCTALTWRWGPPPRPKVKHDKRTPKQKQTKKHEVSSVTRAKESSPYFVSSASFLSLQQLLDRVDLVVLCDALYGNPRDWPHLLYTLSEILSANSSCEVINFCEQRVDDVEGGFLRLLEQENARTSSCMEEASEDESMEAALTRMRGLYEWRTTTEVVSEGESDLGMTVRVTRIRWVLRQRKRPAPSSSSSSPPSPTSSTSSSNAAGGGEGMHPRKRGRIS